MIHRMTILPMLLLSFASIPGDAEATPQWYAGDLHAHSQHSDGDSPVIDLIAKAEAVGLDFFVITDHDSSMKGIPTHWDDPEYFSEELILLYGIEWTTPEGHANIWSLEPLEYAPIWEANLARDPAAAAAEATRQGAIFSLNHIAAFDCCYWDFDLSIGVGIEVWNSSHRLPGFNNIATNGLWADQLKTGRRPTAVGGSDTHWLIFPKSEAYTIGDPTTWVYADAATPEAILQAIEDGRTTISYNPQGQRLELWADSDGDGTFDATSGDDIPADRDMAFRLVVAEGNRPRLEGTVDAPSAKRRSARPKVTELDAQWIGELAQGDSPSEILAFHRAIGPKSCSDAKLVGIFKNEHLVRVMSVECGAEGFDFELRLAAGDWVRAEMIGWPKVNPIQHPVFGWVTAVTNPLFAY